MTPAQAEQWVRQFHAVVDELAGAVGARHGARLRCKAGCSGCCVDGLTVFDVEAERIRRDFPAVLDAAPHPPGACAFLDDAGQCRIYAARPYVCRTQGLPLRWIEEDIEEGEPVAYEARDICPLNLEGGPSLDALAPGDCWDIGPFEARLHAVQHAVDGGRGERTALRSLFGSDARPGPRDGGDR